MSDSNDYKHGLTVKGKQRAGKLLLAVAALCFVWLIYILPFRAQDVAQIKGEDIKAGSKYGNIYVYYIEDLRILDVKEYDGEVYCIAKLSDADGKEWAVPFTPGNDRQLEKQLRPGASQSNAPEMNARGSGYFMIKSPDAYAGSYLDMYAKNHADAANLLRLNADYLCAKYENFTLSLLTRPGLPLGVLATGFLALVVGGLMLIKSKIKNS